MSLMIGMLSLEKKHHFFSGIIIFKDAVTKKTKNKPKNSTDLKVSSPQEQDTVKVVFGEVILLESQNLLFKTR